MGEAIRVQPQGRCRRSKAAAGLRKEKYVKVGRGRALPDGAKQGRARLGQGEAGRGTARCDMARRGPALWGRVRRGGSGRGGEGRRKTT